MSTVYSAREETNNPFLSDNALAVIGIDRLGLKTGPKRKPHQAASILRKQ